MPTDGDTKDSELFDSVERGRAEDMPWAQDRARQAFEEQTQSFRENIPEVNESVIAAVSEEPMKKMLLDIYTRVGMRFGKAVFRSLMKQEFSEDQYIREVQTVLEDQGAVLVKGLTDTTREELRQILIEAQQAGDSIDEIAGEIRSRTERMTTRRAITVARTEVVRASNLGAVRGANMTGLDLKKEWISTMDSRIRRIPEGAAYDHAQMNGRQVDKNEYFQVPSIFGPEALEFPAAMGGSVENVVNCRCTVGFRRK